MRLSKSTPVVFLACINSSHMGRRLRYLINERKAIARMLHQPNGDAWMISMPRRQASLGALLKHPHAARRFRRIEVLHLAGHNNGEKLTLTLDDRQINVSLAELGAWIDRMPSLRLVFLSGCAFPALVDLLMKKDIPAVLATQTFSKNPRATVLARKYYEYLLNGLNYWDAFVAVRKSFPELNALEVAYDLESDQILWPGRDAASGPKVPWGLYFFKERIDLLKPTRDPYPLIPYPRHPYGQRRYRQEKNRQLAQMVALAIIGGLLTASLVFGLKPLPEVSYVIASW